MKKIRQTSLIGQQGVNLIERVCLEMGFLWYPTGAIEAGIDGLIEVRSAITEEPTNCVIQVQSKATEQQFSTDKTGAIEFRCADKDLTYWMAGNAPVILVYSRPKSNEAYWVSIKDYFRDPAKRKSRKVLFDPERDRFNQSARTDLERLAVPVNSGLYLGTCPVTERVSSNLLQLARFPAKYFVASSEFRTVGEIFAAMREQEIQVPGDFVVRSKMIFSFHDLNEPPWDVIADQGTVESHDTVDWADSSDPDQHRSFVQLLNACLKQQLYSRRVRFARDSKSYYFAATPDLGDRRYTYQSREKRTTRFVVKSYSSKKDAARPSYYRHSAFAGRFIRHDPHWYLQITPSYHYTSDGRTTSRFSGSYLSGIKRLENNQAVHGQVVMWAAFLTENKGLFDRHADFLRFSSLAEFDLPVGLFDDQWLNREEETKRDELQLDSDQATLL